MTNDFIRTAAALDPGTKLGTPGELIDADEKGIPFPFRAREGPTAPAELNMPSLEHVAMTRIVLPELPHIALDGSQPSSAR